MACNQKNNCISPVSSDCILYVGDKLKSVDETKLKCNVTVTEVIQVMDEELLKLKDSLDNTKLDKKCFNFNKTTVKQYELNQLLINKICEINDKVNIESNKDLTNIIANTILDVNCTLANCNSANTKTIQDLIQGLCTELLDLKTKYNTLISNNNNNSNLYIPNA